MRVIELSNHPADEVRRTENAIADEHRAIAQHTQAVDRLRAERAASRRWWQLRRRLRDGRAVQELQARRPRLDPAKPQRLAQQQAGVAAEDKVAAGLSVLPDEWTLHRGYANRRGEVDHLLVGPRGVWAIEVKGRGIRVNADGDHWWFEKFDRYGNLVAQDKLVDGGGRSWGRQVTDIAGELEWFLRARGITTIVETAIVVMHDRAELGSFRNSQVSVLSIGTEHLLDAILDQPVAIDAQRLDKIGHLVRRDHRFHAKRRSPRQSR